jgi:hypothetical protein
MNRLAVRMGAVVVRLMRRVLALVRRAPREAMRIARRPAPPR